MSERFMEEIIEGEVVEISRKFDGLEEVAQFEREFTNDTKEVTEDE